MSDIDGWLLGSGLICYCIAAISSGAEAALMFLNQKKVQELDLDNPRIKRLNRLAQDYEKTMLALLIAKNLFFIVGILSLSSIVLGEFSGILSGVVLACLVLGSILFVLVTPRLFANSHFERAAIGLSRFVLLIKGVLTPLTWLFYHYRRFLIWLFHLKKGVSITERELLDFLDEANKEGTIEEHERDLIQSAIEFEDLQVEDVLTPRVDLVAIKDNASAAEIEMKFVDSGFSRLPVYAQDIDHIIGFIHIKDFYRKMMHQSMSLKECLKPVIYIAQQMSIASVLTQLQIGKTHIAIVIDEYGGTMGIVTLEDIIEELVGEIWDEYDQVIEYVVPLSESSYLVNCELGLQKFFDEFELDEDSDAYDATLVNGWLIQEMGRLPKPGDTFVFKNLTIVVMHVNHKKVLDIRVDVESEKGKDNE